MKKIYDLIIIGAGPAGITAAVYAARKKMDALLISKDLGGQASWSGDIQNYTGYQFITGPELAIKFEEHIRKFDFDIKENEEVKKLVSQNKNLFIKTDKDDYHTKTVIIASGKKSRELGIPGEHEFKNKGLTYCATCDGPLFTDRDVIVAGGGNSAVEAAIDLSKIANHVTLVHRSDFRADQVLIDKLKSLGNVEIHLQTQIKSVHGEMLMTHIEALDKASGETIEFKAEGLFVEIGYLPKSELFEGLVELNDHKEVVVNAKTETNVPGIYAAGDVADVPYKQIIISAAEGAKAALSANDYVNKLK